jgi:lysophospholipase L1-like esterase
VTRRLAASAPALAALHGRGRGFFLFLLGALLMPAIPADAAWGPWVPADHESLRWEGRVRFDDAHAAHADWASVRAHLQVEATELLVYARLGENYLDVLVDGQRVAVLGRRPKVKDTAWDAIGVSPAASAEVPVYRVQGLPPGRHHLVLAKRTAPNFGAITLLGLRFDAAARLDAPPPAMDRRLEFVGDSLTNGYGIEGPGKVCSTLAAYENSSLSWARLGAQALKAEAQLLAYSGYGLVRNYGAPGPRSDDPVPFYYPRQVLAEPEPLWDRGRFVPDLTVVFLGTNDYSTPPFPKAAEFENAYAAFLDQLRAGRQKQKILLVYPDNGQTLALRVQAVAESQQMVGHWVETLGLPSAADDEYGCDWHPKAMVHERWALLFEAKVRKMLRWE